MSETVTSIGKDSADNMDFIDNMDKCLEEAFTLADLLAHYQPSYTGGTEFGDTVNNAGHMLMRIMSSTRRAFREREKQQDLSVD